MKLKYKFLFLICLVSLSLRAQTEEKWKTWLTDPAEIHPVPPAENKDRTAEIAAIREHCNTLSAEEKNNIVYWSAGSPGYRWNLVAIDLIERNKKNMEGNRILSLMNASIYDATVVCWEQKDQYKIKRPPAADPSLHTLLPAPSSPAWPCEYATTAHAAGKVLMYLFPSDSIYIAQKIADAEKTGVDAGIAWKEDAEAGSGIGDAVAEKFIAYAQHDNSDLKWDNKMPSGPKYWSGAGPLYPEMGKWKTWVLTSGSQFRADSLPDGYEKIEMEKLKNLQHTYELDRTAYYWSNPLFKILFDITSRKIWENHYDLDPRMAALVYSMETVALYDALVAAWDTKFTYWYTRPSKYDPSWKSAIPTPNFPGYVSGHSASIASVTTLLEYFFPQDTEYFERLANECSMSREYGGIHFDIDCKTGLNMGRQVGLEVVKKAKGMKN